MSKSVTFALCAAMGLASVTSVARAVTSSPRRPAAVAPAVRATVPKEAWSSPELIGDVAPTGPSDQIEALSCPSASLCVAGDGGGSVITTTTPNAPQAVWSHTLVDVGGWVTAASCASTDLCVIGDGSGNLFVATVPTGGSAAWTKLPVDPSRSITSLSCPADNFCVATDDAGDVLTSQTPAIQSSWQIDAIDAGHKLVALSCPSISFCAAVDDSNQLVVAGDTADGALGWSRTVLSGATNPVLSLACTTTRFCVAGDSSGGLLTTDDPKGVWSRSDVDDGNWVSAVGCTDSWCVAGDSWGNAFGAPTVTQGALDWTQTGVAVTGRTNYTTSATCTPELCALANQSGEIPSRRLLPRGEVNSSTPATRSTPSPVPRRPSAGPAMPEVTSSRRRPPGPSLPTGRTPRPIRAAGSVDCPARR